MSNFNLGKSENVFLFSKDQTIQSDEKLNRFIVDSFTYSAVGLAYGMVLSVFFVKQRRIMGYCIGFGLGSALHKNCSPLLNNWSK